MHAIADTREMKGDINLRQFYEKLEICIAKKIKINREINIVR